MRLTMALTVFFTLSTAAWADEPQDSIAATINGQFAAFQARDAATAFGFAAPNIKQIFGTPDQFGAMVQQGYPMVWNPAATRLLGLRQEPDGLWQRVLVTDQSGRGHLLDYRMTQSADGWQISAVILLPPADIGA